MPRGQKSEVGGPVCSNCDSYVLTGQQPLTPNPEPLTHIIDQQFTFEVPVADREYLRGSCGNLSLIIRAAGEDANAPPVHTTEDCSRFAAEIGLLFQSDAIGWIGYNNS
jgi:hypothetical protein